MARRSASTAKRATACSCTTPRCTSADAARTGVRGAARGARRSASRTWPPRSLARTGAGGRPAAPAGPGAAPAAPRPLYAETLAPRLDFGWSDLRVLARRAPQVDPRAAPGAIRPRGGSGRDARPRGGPERAAAALERGSRSARARWGSARRSAGPIPRPRSACARSATPRARRRADRAPIPRTASKSPSRSRARRARSRTPPRRARVRGDRGPRSPEPARELPAGRRAVAGGPPGAPCRTSSAWWTRAPAPPIPSSAWRPRTRSSTAWTSASRAGASARAGRRERPGALQPGRDRAGARRATGPRRYEAALRDPVTRDRARASRCWRSLEPSAPAPRRAPPSVCCRWRSSPAWASPLARAAPAPAIVLLSPSTRCAPTGRGLRRAAPAARPLWTRWPPRAPFSRTRWPPCR